MRYEELLTEMPQLANATGFRMMDDSVNMKLAKKLIDEKHTVLRENKDTILFRTGTVHGNFGLYNKSTKRLDYWVRYEEMQKAFMGQTFTQVILWRSDKSPYTKGITDEVFYNHLLKRWPSIVSDSQQTRDGQRFWNTRMAEAFTRGYKVGFANLLTQDVDWCNGDVEQWLTDNQNRWGTGDKFTGYRFIISQ